MQQVLERGLDVLGGMEALERLSEGSDDQVDKKLELFLVAFKKGCRLPPVLVEELEKPAKVRSHSKEGCNEESNCRGRDQEGGGGSESSERSKEEQTEVREQSTDVHGATSGLDEARTGRGNTGLVRGGERVVRRTRPGGKGKEKGTEEKENMEAREV